MGTKHSTSFSATTITVPFYLTHTPINRVLWVSPATAFCPGHGGRISNIESNRSEFICSLDWLLGMAKTDQRFNNGCSVIVLLLVGVTSIAVGVTHTGMFFFFFFFFLVLGSWFWILHQPPLLPPLFL